MGHVVLGWDGEDAEAPARRARARARHLAVIARWAEAGRLSLGVPLFRADGAIAGSLMVLGGEDEVGVKEYLAEEPFVREGVWLSCQVRPFRIAPLPYAPLPSGGPAPVTAGGHAGGLARAGLAGGGMPERGQTKGPSGCWHEDMTHAVLIAEDAPGAAPRRAAARPAHLARMAPFAEEGVLAMGGALLDAAGAMVGSIAVTRHASEAAARAFWAEDPYVTQRVWGEARVFLTRFAPLPYRPLPRP